MISFFLLRGHPLDRLLNLSLMEKIFYNAVMQKENERLRKAGVPYG